MVQARRASFLRNSAISPVLPAGCLPPQAHQRLKEVVLDTHTTQFKKLKELNEREKKELQKILDRKRNNSISEAKTREKHKKEV